MIITRSILQADASSKRYDIKNKWIEFKSVKEKYHDTYNNTWIFLSHKHGENEILVDVIAILKQHGGDVYVDWMDDTLPTSTSGATAKTLRSKIGNCNKFILVATEAAIASKWCNWELGIGDAKKYLENIAIFPIADNYSDYSGREYMKLYPTIERVEVGNYPDQSTYHVKFPNSERLDSLKSWMLKK